MAGLPKLIIQIAITGTQIMGKAFYAAGQQAVKNAKYKPQGAGSAEAAGVSHAMSGSSTDQLTREHRMTLDEAALILNVKRDSKMEEILSHYEHLFKANSPPAPPAPPANGAPAPASAKRGKTTPVHSHYLQSKVVRALERLRAEQEAAATAEATESKAGETPDPGTPPPPPSDGKAP